MTDPMPSVPRGLIEISRTERDGIPWYTTDGSSDLPFFAALHFRAGRCDETLKWSGITHLIEHLALPAEDTPGVEFNGTVDSTATQFWFSGERERCLELLVATSAALGDLPVGRLQSECRILLTESASRSIPLVPFLLSLRYGPRHHGVSGYDEYAFQWVQSTDVREHAARFFNRANAIVTIAGDTADLAMELDLPDGDRQVVLVPEPIQYLEFPSAFGHGPPGRVAFSMAVGRSYELMTGLLVLERRLREALRYQRGVTYDTSWDYEPLTYDTAHVCFWADTLDENVDRVRNILLTTLDDLARTGPTTDELAIELKAWVEANRDPLAAPAQLFRRAHSELLGDPLPPADEIEREIGAVTSEKVAAALTEAAASLLLCVPAEGSLPAGRFTPYPLVSPYTVDGKRTRRRRRGLGVRRFEGPERELVHGVDGLKLVLDESSITIRYRDVEGLLVIPDGGRGLWSRDGFYAYIDPGLWRDGETIVAEIDRHVSPELAIPLAADGAPVSAFTEPNLVAGQEAFENRELDEAILRLEAGVANVPETTAAWVLLGFAYEGRSRFTDAIAAADRASALDPGLEAPHRIRARAFTRTGRREAAVEAIRAALALEPSEVEVLSDAAWLLGAAGHHEEAMRSAQRATELYPEDGVAWFGLGFSALEAGEFAAAEAPLRKAVALQPDESMWHNNLGWLLVQTGRYKEALRSFERSLELDGANERALSNRRLALALLARRADSAAARAEHLGRVMQRVEAAIARDPTDANALLERATAELVLGRLEDARADALRASVADNAEADFLLDSGWILLSTGDRATARRLFEQGRELGPDVPAAHYYRAILALLDGDAEVAGEAARRVRELNPNERLAIDADAYAALAAGELETAEKLFRHRLRLTPTRCCAAAWLGVTLLRGEAEAAEPRRLLEQARTTCLNGGSACPCIEGLEAELGEPAARPG